MIDDLVGLADVPDEMSDYLLRCGGENPYGKPMYRLVVAENRRIKEAGTFHDWRDEATVSERGGTITNVEDGLHVRRQSTEKVLRTFTGIRLVRKYPGVFGWILERWYPASMYGTRSEWEAAKLPDGTPLIGPYPEQGEYEQIAGPCGEMPNMTELRQVIEFTECSIHNRKGSAADRMRKRIQDAVDKEEKREAAARRETFLKLREQFSFMKSSSLEAGRIREDLANSVRARGQHIGHAGN